MREEVFSEVDEVETDELVLMIDAFVAEAPNGRHEHVVKRPFVDDVDFDTNLTLLEL